MGLWLEAATEVISDDDDDDVDDDDDDNGSSNGLTEAEEVLRQVTGALLARCARISDRALCHEV